MPLYVLATEIRRVAARLVSYNNDEAMSDEDEGEEEDSNSRVEFPIIRSSRPVSPDVEPIKLLPGEELLPPEPTGKCPSDLQEKITRLYESMMQRKIDMNFSIQQRKQFRNPSIYEKLIDHLDIEEIGTNYPTVSYLRRSFYKWGSVCKLIVNTFIRHFMIRTNGEKNHITKIFLKFNERRWRNEKRSDEKGPKLNLFQVRLQRRRVPVVLMKKKRGNPSGIKQCQVARGYPCSHQWQLVLRWQFRLLERFQRKPNKRKSGSSIKEKNSSFAYRDPVIVYSQGLTTNTLLFHRINVISPTKRKQIIYI